MVEIKCLSAGNTVSKEESKVHSLVETSGRKWAIRDRRQVCNRVRYRCRVHHIRQAARKKHVLGLMAHITDLGIYSAAVGLCLMTLPSPLILIKCRIVTNIISSLKFRFGGRTIEDSVPLMNHICIWNPVIDRGLLDQGRICSSRNSPSQRNL